MRRALVATAFGLALSGAVPAVVVAQDQVVVRSPVLLVDSERLFRDSAYGVRIAAEIAARSEELVQENSRIQAELEAEEKALTEQRPSLEPEAFREMADAFDAKVRGFRRAQEAKGRGLVRQRELGQQNFLIAAAPVLEALMRESGAVVVLEAETVFLSRSAVDITTDAIRRIDQEIGDGIVVQGAPEPESAPELPGAD